MLNSHQGWKPAVLIGSSGDQQELTCFEPSSETSAFGSCSVRWKNQMVIFGGDSKTRVISRLDGYRLNKIGSLSFDFRHGSCTVQNELIVLCFPVYGPDTNLCRRLTQPYNGDVSEMARSKYTHTFISISATDSKKLFNFSFFKSL